MNFSYWEHEGFLRNIDTLVVGSGIVGLFSALNIKLNSPLKKVVVCERGTLPHGASTRNAGFACFGSVSELLDDIKARPREEVLQLVKKRKTGLDLLRKTLGDQNIGFEACGGIELFRPDEALTFDECQAHVESLNKDLLEIIGVAPYSVDPAYAKFSDGRFDRAIFNSAEGAVHTGKMMKALIDKCREKGIEIWNGLSVTGFEDLNSRVSVQTNFGALEAKQLVICTNGFASQLLPDEDVTPARNQVLVTSSIPNLPIHGTYHAQQGYIYFRNVGSRLLIGGFRHLFREEETTSEMTLLPEVQQTIEEYIRTNILPQHEYTIDYRWSGIMGVGNSKTHIVKQISTNVTCGIRLGGMGVALGSLVGAETAQMAMNPH